MKIVYNIIHFILICGVAPFIIGFGYSASLCKFNHAVVAGYSLIVYSFPITFLLAIISWGIWCFFQEKINLLVSSFCGLLIGVVMGFFISRILGDNYFIPLSGVIGMIIGYLDFYLFRDMNL